MSRILSPIHLLAGMSVLLLACSTPRKACRKAERLVARAVWKCPEILQLDTVRDTVAVTIPGRDSTGAATYADADPDSLAAVISQLSEALDTERRLFFNAARDIHARAEAERARQAATRNVRRTVCRFKPIHVFDGPLELHIKADGDSIQYAYALDATQLRVPVATPCPPRAQPGKATITGVAEWYRTGFWVLIALLIAIALLTYLRSR